MITSSPCWMSTLMTLKMECLPPTLTTHSFASNDEPSSRLCQAQIASRNGMMPLAGVYFDLFSSIARIAAILMWSGVGKSGSPGPKSAMSMPRAFSLSASAMTAAVGEICMRLMRSVSCTLAPRGEFPLTVYSLPSGEERANTELACTKAAHETAPRAERPSPETYHPDLKVLRSRNFCTQPLLDNCWHQSLQGSTMLSDLPHQFGTQVAVRLPGQHENR